MSLSDPIEIAAGPVIASLPGYVGDLHQSRPRPACRRTDRTRSHGSTQRDPPTTSPVTPHHQSRPRRRKGACPPP